MHSKTKISGFCAIVLDDGLENNKNVFKKSPNEFTLKTGIKYLNEIRLSNRDDIGTISGRYRDKRELTRANAS